MLPLLEKHYRYDACDNLIAELLTQTQRRGMGKAGNEDVGHAEQAIGRFHDLPYSGRSQTAKNLYGYDLNEQLQTVQQLRPAWQATQVEDFKYDKAGNLFDGPKLNGLIKHNRVLVYQDKRYRYDRFGRLSEKRIGSNHVQRFTYDAEHRLVCVEQTRSGDVERIVFGYDPLGRRISKAVYKPGIAEPVSRTLFHWQELRLLQEVQRGMPSLYVYASPSSYEPLAHIDGRPGQEDIQYFHTNLAGLPEQLTDEQGHTLWRSDYHGWGNTRDEWHSSRQGREQNLRYQGQYLDREIGLHYNTFRYFDYSIGRYIQPDPINLLGGINLFTYAPNPLHWVDPLGLARYGNTGGSESTSVNSRELSRNLSLEGRQVGAGQAAGHVVASTGSQRQWSSSVESRKIISTYGVHLNDPANGIPIDHPRPHNTMHTRSYHEAIRDKLKAIVENMRTAGYGKNAIRSALRRELRKLGRCTLE